ncbi:ImmA/IrrE family metallo-endopeptidase [Planctomonas sp. JC2975]|uniref:ArdC-like ssDNA-binding domain-containing protein n=1 Tax=Planctomonas sp. JC2975 TaxID=2729626 RepID=UPI0014760D20|nr:ArdC-like ssDNA-binding domain-containing protein [Planctomonas sp. JC2975]NNC13760.1 ImmA/IrrE family metallo-endopeptidase [Planctomonas sp. JC2975]
MNPTKARTREARMAEAETLHATLTAQVEALASSDHWARFLNFAASFHTYSLNNVLLILAQNPDATHVAGYQHWQELGRQVTKGQHGIRIYATATRRTTPTANHPDQTGEEEEAERVRYFPIVSVFDITQTEPLPGTTPDPDVVQPLTGSDDHGITTPLTAHLQQLGWSVDTEPMTEARNGYTDPTARKVLIRAHVSPAQHAKTLLHEAAHILLEHTNTPTEYVLHRGRMETEAESVAYITAALAGLDTAGYSVGYITGWAGGDVDLIRDTAARVLSTVHRFANILEP